MGAFDDLIPGQAANGGSFADLIPQQPQAPMGRSALPPAQEETFTDKAALAADRVLKFLGEAAPSYMPTRQDLLDLAGGMAGMGGLLDEAPRIKNTTTDSGWKTVGKILDPVTTAVGGKVFQAAKALPGVARMGGFGSNLAAGAASGAAVGAMSGEPLEGAAYGALVPAALSGVARAAAPVLRRGGEMIDAALIPGGATRAAGRVVTDVAKEDATRVAAALRTGETMETAAQAAAPVGRAEFAGLERIIGTRDPSTFGPVGSITQKQAEYVDTLWKDLNAATEQLREVTLRGANASSAVVTQLERQIAEKQASLEAAQQTWGKMTTESAQQANAAQNWFPVAGMPRISSRYAPAAERAVEWGEGAADAATIAKQRLAEKAFREFQRGAFERSGLKPLLGSSVIQNLDAQLQRPEVTANPAMRTILGKFRSEIARYTDPDTGIADAYALYTTRKVMGDNIQDLARARGWNPSQTKAAVKEGQLAIDTAIKQADNSSAWDEYLKQFSSGAKRITALEERAKLAAEQGVVGAREAARISRLDEAAPQAPHFLSNVVTVTNMLLRQLGGYGGAKTTNELARLMQPQNKAELATLIERELARRGQRATPNELRSLITSVQSANLGTRD